MKKLDLLPLQGIFLADNLVSGLYRQVRNFFEHIRNQQKYEIPGIEDSVAMLVLEKKQQKASKKETLKSSGIFDVPISEPVPAYSSQYPDNGFGIYLRLDEFYFDKYIAEGNSILRPIHYPPITQEPDDAVRAAAHGDINLITLLMGAQGKGLQVQNHNGDWIDAIADPDELMINVGDMLSRHTNNKLKSTIHRVVNPPRESWGTSRFSIPFFMHPVSEMPLNALENTVDENNPKLYPDTTAGEFLYERLVELGLIKK
ncbi:hypothetical protein FQR65_LT16374 [Abscondita terminalis]|nr:hypothetical protein FQR65_LT16374 [Abscondita terminalis]